MRCYSRPACDTLGGPLGAFLPFLAGYVGVPGHLWGCAMNVTHEVVLKTLRRGSDRTVSCFVASPRRTPVGLEVRVPSPATPAGFILDRFAHDRVVAVRPIPRRKEAGR